ncbi:MAG: DUF1223 domain-containing protein [Alphaproteobacteria bacterium]|nr:DUF1223 domain-containing protein [Alphaproteobacteria bacterium]
MGLISTGAAAKSPVVVELFTSQGCSSCPPAEAYLHELSQRDDVIALEYHVDYWDYIGWKDPFGSRAYTQRQQKYVASLGGRYAYTPQMVVNGAIHEVGSKRNRVNAIIREAQIAAAPDAPVMTMTRTGDIVTVTLNGTAPKTPLNVLFLSFDGRHETVITRGENSGKTLVNAHVVRGSELIGQWSGGLAEFTVSLKGRKGDGGCAVIVQNAQQGPIAAAASLTFASN